MLPGQRRGIDIRPLPFMLSSYILRLLLAIP